MRSIILISINIYGAVMVGREVADYFIEEFIIELNNS